MNSIFSAFANIGSIFFKKKKKSTDNLPATTDPNKPAGNAGGVPPVFDEGATHAVFSHAEFVAVAATAGIGGLTNVAALIYMKERNNGNVGAHPILDAAIHGLIGTVGNATISAANAATGGAVSYVENWFSDIFGG